MSSKESITVSCDVSSGKRDIVSLAIRSGKY
jgi:hypothetical protein